MNVRLWCMAASIALVASTTRAETMTIATFQDPSPNGTLPLFSFNASGNQLGGGWIFPGLTLSTPSGDFQNVTFSMSAAPGSGPGEVGAGSVVFTSASTDIFTITFDSGLLNLTGFGATEFLATNEVVFSGPIVPAGVGEESFSFAFANQTAVGGDGSFTATAAFTASAIPEPATVGLIGLGGCMVLRRVRRRSRVAEAS